MPALTLPGPDLAPGNVRPLPAPPNNWPSSKTTFFFSSRRGVFPVINIYPKTKSIWASYRFITCNQIGIVLRFSSTIQKTDVSFKQTLMIWDCKVKTLIMGLREGLKIVKQDIGVEFIVFASMTCIKPRTKSVTECSPACHFHQGLLFPACSQRSRSSRCGRTIVESSFPSNPEHSRTPHFEPCRATGPSLHLPPVNHFRNEKHFFKVVA